MDVGSVQRIRHAFWSEFGVPAQVSAWAPGRINLIGEHTDYNAGLVMPAAIDLGIALSAGRRTDNRMCLLAADPGEVFSATLSDIQPSEETTWANYVLGAVAQLQQAGLPIQGFNLAFGGNLPQGAGLSASAALSCGVLTALCQLFDLEVAPWQLVSMAQQVEHTFVGVHCGIMDMFACIFGKKDQAMMLDCHSLDFRYVPLGLPGHSLVVLHTGVRHHLADSAYNQRRAECAQGLAWVQAHVPGILSLRDATADMLVHHVAPRDSVVYRRCTFVLEENKRVEDAAACLGRGDAVRLGTLLNASHEGLRTAYAVSCPELDFLQDFAASFPGVRGARMMGGGFGGCTLNLVATQAVAPLLDAAGKAYSAAFGRTPEAFHVSISDGAGNINQAIMY